MVWVLYGDMALQGEFGLALGSLSCAGAGDLTPEDLALCLPSIGTVFLVVRWCESQSQRAEVLLRDPRVLESCNMSMLWCCSPLH